MRIVKVAPKDIHVTFEMSLEEVGHLLFFLERTAVKFDGSKSEEQKSIDFVIGEFFKTLSAVEEDFKDGP